MILARLMILARFRRWWHCLLRFHRQLDVTHYNPAKEKIGVVVACGDCKLIFGTWLRGT